MNLVFRVDASIEIGTGHVMRCLALADSLRHQGHHCKFICRKKVGSLEDLIATKGYEVYLLGSSDRRSIKRKSNSDLSHGDWLGTSQEEDVTETIKVLFGQTVDWIVVDHYALDLLWEKEIRRIAKNIMVIDDLADRKHDCDLLLDQNLGRKEYDYDGLVPTLSKRLIGPRYALLRPEFAQLREQSILNRDIPKLERILVSLGGVDVDNLTEQVLDVLRFCNLPQNTEVDVVMGSRSPYIDEVKAIAQSLPYKIKVTINVNDMATRMSNADLTIGAAGSTAWERCCLGLPSIVVISAENQRLIGESLGSMKCALLVDRVSLSRNLKELVNFLVSNPQVLREMSQSSAKVCDGLGLIRVSKQLIELRRDENNRTLQ